MFNLIDNLSNAGVCYYRMSSLDIMLKRWNHANWFYNPDNKTINIIDNSTQNKIIININDNFELAGTSDISSKVYRGLGTLHKFTLFEKLDHGKIAYIMFAFTIQDDAIRLKDFIDMNMI